MTWLVWFGVVVLLQQCIASWQESAWHGVSGVSCTMMFHCTSVGRCVCEPRRGGQVYLWHVLFAITGQAQLGGPCRQLLGVLH